MSDECQLVSDTSHHCTRPAYSPVLCRGPRPTCVTGHALLLVVTCETCRQLRCIWWTVFI